MTDASDGPNRAQAEYWTKEGGPSWVRNERRYERMLQPFDDALLDALAPRSGEHVLEIGCGFGTTALAIASTGATVHGVDIAAPMIDRARERVAVAGASVTFAVADAQEEELGGPFDAVASRFGVMFFIDPVRAFSNIGAAVAPGGRLAFTCWQSLDRNPWLSIPIEVVRQFNGETNGPATLAPGAPNPLSFADASHTEAILDEAGWTDISITPVEPLLRVGGDDGIEGAVELALNGSSVKALLQQGDESLRADIVGALTDRFSRFDVDGATRMQSSAWLVTARRSI